MMLIAGRVGRYVTGAVLVLALARIGVHQLGAQSTAPNHDPDAARLITSDMPNFWRAFDHAPFCSL
jgi:hypothetical protein